jgi:uncharacterized membrane protein
MDSDDRRAASEPSSVRRFPADLAAVVVFTLLTLGAVFLPVVRETPLRVVLGFPFVLFVPGYVFVAALFPEADRGEGGEEEDGEAVDGGLSVVERVGLSFAASLVVAPTIGLLLNATPLGIQLTPVVVALSVVVLGLTVVAARRRLALPVEDRLRVSWRERLAGLHAELTAPEDRTDALLNVALAVALLVAASTVGYAIAVPTEGQSYSELYLLTGSGDDLTAADYPSEFTAGEGHQLVVGVGNREHEPVTYTLLVEAHRVAIENESVRVLERERLARFRPRVGSNGTWHQEHTVDPTLVGDRVRVTYLLYRGRPPAEPTVDDAYRSLHLWVNVTAA